MMTFDQLSQKVQQQLNSVTQRNQQLMKKAEIEHDPQFLKNFNIFKKQIQDEISDTQEVIKLLMNKAKTITQKNQGKKYNEQIQQEFERYKNSVKKIVNNSFAQKHDTLRKSSVMNNSRSIDSDGGMNEASGRNDYSQKGYQQQQDQAYKQEQWNQLDLEKQLNEERQQEFNQFEKEIIQINENFNKIGQMIGDQGVMIDVIEDTHFQTKEQVVAARREITEADKTQQSAKRKYIIFALIILIALGVTLAIVFTQM